MALSVVTAIERIDQIAFHNSKARTMRVPSAFRFRFDVFPMESFRNGLFRWKGPVRTDYRLSFRRPKTRPDSQNWAFNCQSCVQSEITCGRCIGWKWSRKRQKLFSINDPLGFAVFSFRESFTKIEARFQFRTRTSHVTRFYDQHFPR